MSGFLFDLSGPDAGSGAHLDRKKISSNGLPGISISLGLFPI